MRVIGSRRARRGALGVLACVATVASLSAALVPSAASTGSAASIYASAPSSTPMPRGIVATNKVVPARDAAAPAPWANPECPQCRPPLIFHSDRGVLGTAAFAGEVTVAPVYWVPAGYALTSNYQDIVNTYLDDVAADSTQPSNVYSINEEYYELAPDGSKRQIHYLVHSAAPVTMSTAYPLPGSPSDCVPDGGYTACVTDAQLQAALTATLAAQGLPSDAAHVYAVFLPPSVQSCFESASQGQADCSGTEYCAYHSAAGSSVYAMMPFQPLNVCTDPVLGPQAPNGDTEADAVLSPLSHELSEAITDTDGAWFDSAGYENGDECAYVYGDPVGHSNVSTDGSATGTAYNQVINGHFYYTQDEFSNIEFAAGAGDHSYATSAHPVVPGCFQRRTTLYIVPATLPTGPIYKAYRATLTSKFGVGTLHWSVGHSPGATLPPGLTMSTAGVISGTPAAGSVGTSTFPVFVTDSAKPTPQSATATFSITITPLTITTTSLQVPVGKAVNLRLAETGGKGTLHWSAGTLPAGLKLSTAGQLTGTPTTAGTYGVPLALHDSAVPVQSTSALLQLTVLPFTVLTASVADAHQGKYYTQKLVAQGGTGTLVWKIDSGALPIGLKLSAAGTIAGTAPKLAQSATFTVRVTDHVGRTATRTYTLQVV